MIEQLDLAVIGYLNGFARTSLLGDLTVSTVTGNSLLKCTPVVMLLWWSWFRAPQSAAVRSRLCCVGVAAFPAIAVARFLAVTLPHRLRPLHDGNIAFVPPYGVPRATLDGWSAFPSDHAVLFFAISCGLLFAHRAAGLLALSYTVIVIALPRIYLGLHFPSDILAGALIGAAITCLFQHRVALRFIGAPIQRWSVSRPELFYPLFFVLSYQIAELFSSARTLWESATILISL